MGDRVSEMAGKAALKALRERGVVKARAYEGNGGRADFVVYEKDHIVFYRLRLHGHGVVDMPYPNLSSEELNQLERAIASWVVEHDLDGVRIVAGLVDVSLLDTGTALIRRTTFA